MEENNSRDKRASSPSSEGRPQVATMTGRDVAIALIKADLATGKATKRSLGIMYAHVMAGTRASETEPYREVNTAIMDAKGFKYLDGVKLIAWQLYEVAREARVALASDGKASAPQGSAKGEARSEPKSSEI